MLASSLFFETSIPNTPSITVLSFHLVSSARAPLRTTLYAGSTLTRVPRYRPISKAELGKRGLIYGTGSRAKRQHRLTVLLAAQQNVFIRQAIAPAAPSALHLPRFRPLASCRRRLLVRVEASLWPASATLHKRGHTIPPAQPFSKVWP